MNVKKPHSSRNMTMNTYASGEEKYAPSSRLAIVRMFAQAFISMPPLPYPA